MNTTHDARPTPALVTDTSSSTPCCAPVEAPPSLSPTQTAALADRLRALADPTRLGMLDLLAQQPDALCVCDITSQFDLRQPTISHHLRILREAGLITAEKRGVWSYYRATEEGKRALTLISALT